ncbi:uncharacterized protein LOC113299152 [Papaver somniferum]|uniref:uncharacterized protein LOC113299152 n=1 Tax=Papaver somniferum TaxID=3469 RepID=UPI000E702F99|nr:uncharacterized protein LOC113299152 [Papaver somniferum]XP_026403903.1 uncharacterized protein LOC113299152 [Papaver somniferum]XP_026403904.1 uncharacterized protein LOC113299152 [Papaver somniferum]
MSTDSERTVPDELDEWNIHDNNIHNNPVGESIAVPRRIQESEDATHVQHQISSSHVNFLTSDIDSEFEIVSDSFSSSPTSIGGPGQKRLNPEQQAFLHNSGIGTSSAHSSTRGVSNEEVQQWKALDSPAKRLKTVAADQTSNLCHDIKLSSNNTSSSSEKTFSINTTTYQHIIF